MKTCCFSLLLLLTFFKSSAQSSTPDKKYLDSLNQLIEKTSSDSIKARNYFLLSDFWREQDTTKSKAYLEKGKAHGDKYPYLKAIYYSYLANYYLGIDGTKSEINYLKADKELSAFSTKEAYQERAGAWHNYALVQQHQDDHKGALDALINHVLPLSKKAGDKIWLGTEYISIAAIFMNLKQYDKAIPYLNQGIEHFQNAPSSQYFLLVNAYLTAADNYSGLGKYQQTKKYLDLAKILLDKSKNVVSPYRIEIFLLDYYKCATTYFTATKQYQKALQHANEAIKLAKELNDNYSLQEIAFDKHTILIDQKRYPEAEKILMDLVKQKETNSLTQNRLKTFNALASLHYTTGNMAKAYIWLKKSKTLGDSLSESKLKTDISNLEIKYKTAEKEKKIVSLHAENENANYKIKQNRLLNWLLSLTSLFLFVIAILGWLFYRNSKKLATQKELNHQQQLIDIERQRQIDVVQVMLDTKEDEQNRVARDLHDGLGGMLSTAKVNLTHYTQEKTNNTDTELGNVVVQLENAITELRRIAHNMIPGMLLKLGLEAALRDLCETLSTQNLDVVFQWLNIQTEPPVQEQITIYRIVQEALTNAVKHADAKNILLQCTQSEDVFFITVDDDGKGFDVGAPLKNQGIGLKNIKSRVEHLSGTIEILSKENEQGTSINIELNVTT
ncbi:sensor histidine kinase [Pedobacter foliorum]|uniref:ATP-binding protein n=1 Tax=Pedobacter foliorum TaxID=2739058 RepID=UPI001564B570|nr:sensor histidine kinase [Pedobacter foliorum]NRF37883.1 sensor histidine kinase [Pedobacter foliorum]